MSISINKERLVDLRNRDEVSKLDSENLAFSKLAQKRFSKEPTDSYVRSDKKGSFAWFWTGVKCFFEFETAIDESRVALLESGDLEGFNKLEEGLKNSRLYVASKVGTVALIVTTVALAIILGALVSTPFGWAVIAGIVLASAIGARILGIGGTLLYYLAKDGVKDKISMDFSIVERIQKKKQNEHHNYDPIFETENKSRLFLGALPNRVTADIEDLRKEGVKAVVSVNQPWERRPWSISVPYSDADYQKVGMDYKKLQVDDHTYPSVEQLNDVANYIHGKMEKGENVYVHCRAGHGRSAMLIAAYLIKHRGMSAEEAVEQIKGIRHQSTVGKKLIDRKHKEREMVGLNSFEKKCRAEEKAKNDQLVGGLAGLLLGVFSYARSYF